MVLVTRTAPGRIPEGQRNLFLHLYASPDGGLVPLAGSRETPSFLITVPNAVPEALGSVSHGAGRKYDRASMHGRIRKTRSELGALNVGRPSAFFGLVDGSGWSLRLCKGRYQRVGDIGRHRSIGSVV